MAICFQHWNDKDGATLAQAIEFVDSVRSRSWCIAIILMDSGNLSVASRSLDTIQKLICKSIGSISTLASKRTMGGPPALNLPCW